MASKKNKTKKATGKKATGTRPSKKVTDGTVKSGTDFLGREVRHFVENGTHYVEANRNGATHPEECKDAKAATKLYTQHMESED